MSQNLPETPKDPKNLTEDQKKVLAEVYLYSDKAEYTEQELALARQMFDTPEKFALLRKILQVLTPEERGMTIPSAQAFVQASPENLAKYAFETAVDVRADEKIRQTLVSFYRIVRTHIQDDMKKEFEAKNQEEFEEGKRTEQYNEEQEEKRREVGERL